MPRERAARTCMLPTTSTAELRSIRDSKPQRPKPRQKVGKTRWAHVPDPDTGRSGRSIAKANTTKGAITNNGTLCPIKAKNMPKRSGQRPR